MAAARRTGPPDFSASRYLFAGGFFADAMIESHLPA
jgi:hypothetical protein